MIKRSLILIIYFLFLFEFFSFLFTKFNLFTFNETPQIYKKNKNYSPGTLWRNESNSWGAWHKINAKDIHTLDCFDVSYESNNIGARDNFFSVNSKKKRSIVLGDSMTEGIGLSISERFDQIIERKLKTEILNFGSGGDLGPLAYYLIYKDLASKFEHENLFIFLFPQNDFTDHNLQIWDHNGWNVIDSEKRFRPYSKRINDNKYEIVYEKKSKPRKNFDSDENTIDYKIKLWLKKYLWTTNVLRSISQKLKTSKEYNLIDQNNIHKNSFYFNKLNTDNDAFFWLEKLLQASLDKKVYIFILPSIYDLELIKKNGISKPIWLSELSKLQDKNENLKNIINLANFFSDEPKSYFHTCDYHYNAKANIIISDVVTDLIF